MSCREPIETLRQRVALIRERISAGQLTDGIQRRQRHQRVLRSLEGQATASRFRHVGERWRRNVLEVRRARRVAVHFVVASRVLRAALQIVVDVSNDTAGVAVDARTRGIAAVAAAPVNLEPRDSRAGRKNIALQLEMKDQS